MTKLEELLGLTSPPVAIAFRPAAPEGVARVTAGEPASCGYWRRAAAGEVFFTVAADHKRCPVGAHTHQVPLAEAEKAELEGLLNTMVGIEYLKMEELAGIPTMSQPFQVAVYAPLERAPVPPDVVLVRGDARQLMLLSEAAESAALALRGATFLRPTCAVIPAALRAQQTALSLGCIGNRVYTGLGDGEAYFAIPGAQLAAVEERLSTILTANRELETFHRCRLNASA
jgi:uncharacterized protein (DUF169 family)